ncbi:DinB family protein [Hymenobacter weizhouensis]|uniref:DinB family protein n=1 Tax=Hymenobacter sp. YIM 151500-1 TaxID=2987689 RepID=UPI002227A518|nr:DinB family protein [Hymenobacter sp. YIM 151500-1]UYZ63404.1 DinB family protein [Hymenobacter sp. YIM 151500-1]
MLLAAQYALVQSARAVLLDQLATLPPADFLAPVATFNHSSLRDLLVHVANCYRHWLGVIAQGQPRPYFDPATVPDVAAARQVFGKVDALVTSFVQQQEGAWQRPQTLSVPGRPAPLTLTPLELFTHVITHEFHHKGQLLSMARQLGYPPVDTDVIRF